MRIFLSLIIIFCINICFAQKTVTGVVTDKSGNFVKDVSISVKFSDIKTFTNFHGKYSVDVPDGFNVLEFSKTGYKTQEITISENSLNVVLLLMSEVDIFDLSLEELMKIEVISATKQTQKISDAPAIISIITAEQILQRAYSTVGEAINSLPGIYVLDDHLQKNVGVRGINGGMQAYSRIVKVMIDNQPVSFRSTTENWLGIELIPINAVERIEIVRGPASTLYGANAFLGVINIITKKGKNIDGGVVGGDVHLRGENIGSEWKIVAGKKFENSQFLISYHGNYIEKSGMKIKNMPGRNYYNEKSVSQNDVNFSQSIFAKYNYSSDKIGDITFSYLLQNFDNYGEFQEYSVLSHTNRILINNSYSKLRYSNVFFQKFTFLFSAAVAYGKPSNKQVFTRKPEINATTDTIKRDVGYVSYDFNTELSYKFKTLNTFTFGTDFTTDKQNLQTYYQKDKNENFAIPLQSVEYKDTTFNNLGIYLQGIFHPFSLFNANILNDLSLTAGIRYDYHSIYGNNFNQRFALVYPFNANFYIKAMFGQSFKAPSSVQLYTNALYTRGVIGNDKLKPEKANTYEVLFGLNIGKNINLLLNFFKNDITDKVEVVPFESNYAAQNVSQINSLGMETEIIFFNKFFKNYINFSYQKSSFNEKDPITPNKIIKRNTRLFPNLMLKCGTNFAIKKLFTNINIEGKFIDEIIASTQNLQKYDGLLIKEYSLPSYFVLDITFSSTGIKIFGNKETTFFIAIKNLLNTEYFLPGYKDFDIYGNSRCISVKFLQFF